MPLRNDDQIPQPVGDTAVAPAVQTPERLGLGQRLDTMFSMNGRAERPSEWLSGAVFVSRTNVRGNADWVAQAAHSLREILYRLCSPRMGGGDDAMREFLANYGAAQDVETSLIEMNAMYTKLCEICHHGIKIEETDEGDFDNLLAAFERVMTAALERQLDVHNEIDELPTPEI